MAYAAAVLFITCWIIAVIADGSWTYGKNTLSDLGISKNILSVFLFNWAGCFATAVIWMPLSISIFRTEKGMGRICGALVICCMIFLALIGVVNKGFGIAHNIVALTYMGFTIVAMIVSCFSDFFNRRKIYVVITIILMISDIIMYLNLSFAATEANAILSAIFWSVLLAEAHCSYQSKNNA